MEVVSLGRAVRISGETATPSLDQPPRTARSHRLAATDDGQICNSNYLSELEETKLKVYPPNRQRDSTNVEGQPEVASELLAQTRQYGS
ncbi:hypothetical protein J6590_011411 [Homalodisca vitripennis]|nr:hypothetical protein J6590_011411 [Homalodisca vitripennis]